MCVFVSTSSGGILLVGVAWYGAIAIHNDAAIPHDTHFMNPRYHTNIRDRSWIIHYRVLRVQ